MSRCSRLSRQDRNVGIGSSTLLQLPIPYFCYLPVSVFPESNHGYGNWPMWPSGRGNWGGSNSRYPHFCPDAITANSGTYSVFGSMLTKSFPSMVMRRNTSRTRVSLCPSVTPECSQRAGRSWSRLAALSRYSCQDIQGSHDLTIRPDIVLDLAN